MQDLTQQFSIILLIIQVPKQNSIKFVLRKEEQKMCWDVIKLFVVQRLWLILGFLYLITSYANIYFDFITFI